MFETCKNCNSTHNAIVALGAWPRCQHRITGRDFDPHSQCVFKSHHKGCHKAEYPDNVDIWSCVNK